MFDTEAARARGGVRLGVRRGARACTGRRRRHALLHLRWRRPGLARRPGQRRAVRGTRLQPERRQPRWVHLRPGHRVGRRLRHWWNLQPLLLREPRHLDTPGGELRGQRQLRLRDQHAARLLGCALPRLAGRQRSGARAPVASPRRRLPARHRAADRGGLALLRGHPVHLHSCDTGSVPLGAGDGCLHRPARRRCQRHRRDLLARQLHYLREAQARPPSPPKAKKAKKCKKKKKGGKGAAAAKKKKKCGKKRNGRRRGLSFPIAPLNR